MAPNPRPRPRLASRKVLSTAELRLPMPETRKPDEKTEPATELAAELKARIGTLVDALVHKDDESYEAEFVHLLSRVRELVDRKVRMEGTKTDTRDFLGELLFTRLRRGM